MPCLVTPGLSRTRLWNTAGTLPAPLTTNLASGWRSGRSAMVENYELCYRPQYRGEKGEWQPNELREPQPESIRQVIKILRDGALDGIGTARGALLGDEQGLGKTATAIIAVYTLRNLVGGYRRILVVASKNLLPVWKAEIERWQASPDLVITLKDGHSINPDTVKCGWLLVSYDTVGRYFPPVRRSQMPPFDLLITDEIQHFKEPSIKRTKMVYGGKYHREVVAPIPAKNAICLSGTPVKNRIEEIHTALHYLDPTRWPDRTQFIDQHYEAGYLVDNKGRVTGHTRNLDPLRNTLRSTILVRHRKDGILKPKRYERIYLGLNDL